MVCGNLKIISLPYPTKEGAKEVSVIGILFKMEMSSLKMHANARIDDIKRFEDGTLYIEVYAEERLLSDLPAKNGLNYLNMYVRKDNYLTYNGESYKLIDDENKSITWKDGSKSPYGQRITLFDRLEPYIVFGMFGSLLLYVLFVEWKIKRKYKKEK
jgi:hypothetical protein